MLLVPPVLLKATKSPVNLIHLGAITRVLRCLHSVLGDYVALDWGITCFPVKCFFLVFFHLCGSFQRLYGAIQFLPPDVEPVIWDVIDNLMNIAPGGQSSHTHT